MEPLFGQDARFDQLCRVGGSHAQREVFEDTLMEAYLRAGQYEKAEVLLGNRLKRRESPRDMFSLARAQEDGGNHEAAAASIRNARDGWPDADQGSQETAELTSLAERVG